MSLATVIAISALIQGVLLPQTAPPSIEDVIHRYEKGLRKIAGVKEIVSEKAGGVATITIRVETEESRDMARFMTGEALESYPVRILVSKLQLPAGPEAAGPAGSVSAEEANCPHCPIHCPLPRSPRTETAPINPPTVGTPKTDDGKSPETTKASRPSIEDVIHSYEKGLRRIEGVREIYPDQVGGVATITVRVETAEARDTVQFMIGEKLGGYPVRMLLSTTPLSGRPDSVSPVGRSPSEEASCIHCSLHCPSPSPPRTEVEAPQTPPAATAKTVGGQPQEPTKADEMCSVMRKREGLPPRKDFKSGCEEMLTTTNNPDKIRWAIEHGLPHWVSKEMPGVRGNSKEGIACGQHGSHSFSEFVCYTWIRHSVSCPLGGKNAPKDLTGNPR